MMLFGDGVLGLIGVYCCYVCLVCVCSWLPLLVACGGFA